MSPVGEILLSTRIGPAGFKAHSLEKSLLQPPLKNRASHLICLYTSAFTSVDENVMPAVART